VPSDARTLAELLGTVSLCPSSKGSEMAVIGLTHININCSDYERSKAFYELLGFREFWQVPETNRAEIAAAVGMAPYRVRGALLKLETDESGGVPLTIDLLQWIDPHDDAAPYPHLYHRGIARIALTSSDLDADVARLKSAGVEFISDPVQLDPGSPISPRFVCFKDPDGTVLEFVENATARI
jgi:catechol 2,3-dioxygenase-like lactoylglutathione lyase family enzyme